jgi:hypothetical protein
MLKPKLLKKMVLPVGIEPTTSPLPREITAQNFRASAGISHNFPMVTLVFPWWHEVVDRPD